MEAGELAAEESASASSWALDKVFSTVFDGLFISKAPKARTQVKKSYQLC